MRPIQLLKWRQVAIVGLIILIFLSACATSQPENECLKGNCVNGMGTMIWVDGTVYAGQWVDENMHGSGVMQYPDGTKYAGQWSQGMRHGTGEVTYADGTKQRGLWESNKLIRNLARTSSKKVDNSSCVGIDCAPRESGDPQNTPGSSGQVNLSTGETDEDEWVEVPETGSKIPLKKESQSFKSNIPSAETRDKIRSDDYKSPQVRIISPLIPTDGVYKTESDRLVIKGEARDESGIYKVTVNSFPVDKLTSGKFSAEVDLKPGVNIINLMIIDNAFNSEEIQLIVNRVSK